MRFLWLLIAFAFPTLALGSDYRTDPRLAKAISIHVKLVPLSECMKAFSDATGVGIYVAPNIAERKVTVIFKNRRASEAMGMLAQTLFCDWTNEVDGFRLELPHETVNQELGLLSAEQAVLKERLAAFVEGVESISDRPKDELIEQREEARAKLASLRFSHDHVDQKKVQEAQKQFNFLNQVNWYEMGYALRNGPSAQETLAAGGTVFASTDRGKALPLPISAVPGGRVRVVEPGPDGKPVIETRTPTGAVAAMRCNPVTGRFQFRLFATGIGTGGSIRQSQEEWLLDTGEAENKLWKMPLRKRLRDWGRTLDAALLTRKLAKDQAVASPGYLAEALTMADHLEHLAEAADIPVISDAFRQPVSGESYFNAATVGDYVRQLRDNALPSARGAAFRTEKGWLLCRHARYWRMLDSEIPEKLFAPIEAKVAAKKPLTLDDYATFATALTPWQAMVFCYRPSLTRFPRLPLIHAMPALRLWGSLGSDQRNQAYAQGLPLAAMGPAQQDLYRTALNELLWIGNVNETFLPILMGDMRGSADIGLFFQDGQNGAQAIMSGDTESMASTPPPIRTAQDLALFAQESYIFAFGNSAQSGASFSFQIIPEGQ
ncbi:MAG TPA: hypothetical protein VHE55_08975 [Fimbriimonadaceae bacterium]|nr:hypothetical protein [Fimbriimonadaceae bacterium]